MIEVTLTQSGVDWSEEVPVPASISEAEYNALPSRTVFVRPGYILDLSAETDVGFTYDQIVGRTIGEIRFLFPAESDADFKRVEVTVDGAGPFVIVGSPSFETIYGGPAGDTIYDGEFGGGAGFSDQLYGGGGNDTYYVNSSDTDVFEAVSAGNDTIIASTAYDLRPGQAVETLIGTDHVGGNELANVLGGGSAADRILGHAGADTLTGGGGDDLLVGGDGDDSLSGGAGADLFLFRGEAGRDAIADFGMDDVLVTTGLIRDSNGDGIITFGADRLLDLAGGGSVAIRDERGRVVTAVEYDGSYVNGEVTYFVYSRVGSAAGVETAAARDLSDIGLLLD